MPVAQRLLLMRWSTGPTYWTHEARTSPANRECWLPKLLKSLRNWCRYTPISRKCYNSDIFASQVSNGPFHSINSKVPKTATWTLFLARSSASIFKIKISFFWDTLILKRFFKIIKMNIFRGDLTDISAKAEVLARSPDYRGNAGGRVAYFQHFVQRHCP